MLFWFIYAFHPEGSLFFSVIFPPFIHNIYIYTYRKKRKRERESRYKNHTKRGSEVHKCWQNNQQCNCGKYANRYSTKNYKNREVHQTAMAATSGESTLWIGNHTDHLWNPAPCFICGLPTQTSVFTESDFTARINNMCFNQK